ncbi:ABC transporter permease [Moorellaceae bacterium AZ2]
MRSKLLDTLNYLIVATLAIVIALVLSSFVLLWQGTKPWEAYAALFQGAFSGLDNFGASVVLSMPLMLAGLGIALAFRAGIFNIGAEGQLYLGAMAATFVGSQVHSLPLAIHLPLALAASGVVGGLWAFIPGYLKIRRGFNEVITTILLNYIGVHFVNYSVHSFLKDPATFAPQSPPVAPTARLPKLVAGSELNAGLFLGLLLAVLLFLLLYKTDWGYQLRAVGSNPVASRTAGINVDRTLMLAMVSSGALAGLGGAVQILGYQNILLQDFSPNTGYDAIAVALLGRLHPLGTVASALFFGALRNGVNTMQIIMGVPVTIVYVIQAVIILCVLGFSKWKLDITRLLAPREVDTEC